MGSSSDHGSGAGHGANGFVGKWTAVELLRAGFSVRGSVRSEGRAQAVRQVVEAPLGEAAVRHLDFVRLDLLHDFTDLEAMQFT